MSQGEVMDGRLTAEDLAKLVELDKAATPRPWSAELGEYVHTGWTVITARGEGMTPSSPLAVIGKISNVLGEDEAMKEAALIAAARNALPALLASAAAAQTMREALEGLLRVRDWAIKAGGTEGPLPHDVIVKFAEMQSAAVDAAMAAIEKATSP